MLEDLGKTKGEIKEQEQQPPKQRVFYGGCVYFKKFDSYSSRIIGECKAPNNIIEECNFYGCVNKYKMEPEEKNKHNDCQDFKKRGFWDF